MIKGNVRYLRTLTLCDDIFHRTKGLVRTAALVAFTTWIASATCIIYWNEITQVYFIVLLVLMFLEMIMELMHHCLPLIHGFFVDCLDAENSETLDELWNNHRIILYLTEKFKGPYILNL